MYWRAAFDFVVQCSNNWSLIKGLNADNNKR